MNTEEKDIDLIEKYLEGKLQGADYQEFKSRLAEDEEFNQSLMEMETMVSGIRYTGRQKVIQELKRLESGLPQPGQPAETKVLPIRRFKTWAAAAAILLIAVTAMWLVTRGPVDQQELFISYYQPYPNLELPTTRSNESPISLKEQAYLAYDLGQYEQAVKYFDNLSGERNDIDDFYWALSNMSNQQPEAAESLLKAYLEKGDSSMRGQAQWYLALAYLKQGKTNESQDLLTLIVETQSHNFKKASTLLEELK